MNARSLLSMLFHADKALDLVRTAREFGLLARLDAGPVTLGEMVAATGALPLRLYKFLDGLESLGLVVRQQASDELLDARYRSREPLAEAVEAVLGERSIEKDRDRYPWREIHGRLAEVLSGRLDVRCSSPPQDYISAPIVDALREARDEVFDPQSVARHRWLDVGGGDGAIAEPLLREDPSLSCDVFNLPSEAPLVVARARNAGLEGRLGMVGGDFLREPLPEGYDVLSFIRVLHDWPADVAFMLLRKARQALAPGARIVVCEEFRTEDRLAAHLFWTYFLIGVDACMSRLREVEWYTEALFALGFHDIQVIPNEVDLVTAVAI